MNPCCFRVRFHFNIDEPLVKMVMGGGSSNFDGPNTLRVNRPLNAYKYEIRKTKTCV